MGIGFWKSPSRKLHAVTSKNFAEQHIGAGEKRPSPVSDSESDEEAGSKAKKQWDHMNYKLDKVLHEMTFMKENFEEAMKLSQDIQSHQDYKKA